MTDETKLDGTQPEAPESEGEGKTYTQEDYKKWQRDLQKARNQATKATNYLALLEELKEGQRQTSDAVTTVLEFIAGRDDIDGADVLKEAVKGAKTKSEATGKVNGLRLELVEALNEAGLEWTDPEVDEVRKEWNKGDYSAALDRARKQLKPDNEDARVAAAVAKALKAAGVGKVDEGSSTTKASSKPKSLVEAAKLYAQGRLTDQEYQEEKRRFR